MSNNDQGGLLYSILARETACGLFVKTLTSFSEPVCYLLKIG